MKKPVITILCMFAFSFNAYADQYIQNLKSQEIAHYESLGYKFINIGDGWHTIKPMETVCGEIIKPINADGLSSEPLMKTTFRHQYGIQTISYLDNKEVGSHVESGFYIFFKYPYIGVLEFGSQHIEAKFCIKNVSLESYLEIEFPLDIDSIIK